jgi:hypothetical protein
MAEYLFKRDEDGNSYLELVDPVAPKVEQAPPEPTVEGTVGDITVWRCMPCNKDFPIVPLAAKHFHREHKDLDKEADSWRTYITEVMISQ